MRSLTLAGFKNALRSALAAKGIEAEIIEARWTAPRCKERFGAAYFRNGQAKIRHDGRTMVIAGNIDTCGGHRFFTPSR